MLFVCIISVHRNISMNMKRIKLQALTDSLNLLTKAVSPKEIIQAELSFLVIRLCLLLTCGRIKKISL